MLQLLMCPQMVSYILPTCVCVCVVYGVTLGPITTSDTAYNFTAHVDAINGDIDVVVFACNGNAMGWDKIVLLKLQLLVFYHLVSCTTHIVY